MIRIERGVFTGRHPETIDIRYKNALLCIFRMFVGLGYDGVQVAILSDCRRVAISFTVYLAEQVALFLYDTHPFCTFSVGFGSERMHVFLILNII